MTDSEDLHPANVLPPLSERAFALASQQQMLYEVLGEFDNPMARIYLGAIYVLGDSKNPDRLALAAHNLRELLSRLPKRLGLDTTSFQEKLDNELFSLREQWEKTKRNSKCRRSDSWDGEIDPPLLKFLSLIPEFFDWYDSIKPRRKQVVTRTLRRLDPAPVNLPVHIEEENWREWQALYSYFAALAHHEKHANIEEFQLQVDRLERYLIIRLRPGTFEDINDIENLIRQAEGHD